MKDWRIKDYAIRCYNLQNKLTPFAAHEYILEKKKRYIQKKKQVDELTAWQILKNHLQKKVNEMEDTNFF